MMGGGKSIGGNGNGRIGGTGAIPYPPIGGRGIGGIPPTSGSIPVGGRRGGGGRILGRHL